MERSGKVDDTFQEMPGDDIIICRCEEITQGEIRRAIHEGMVTYNEIKRYLRAGMGLCQGQTCCRNVRAILAKELGIPVSQVGSITGRAPVRPVPLGVLGNFTHEWKEGQDGQDQ